MPRMKCSIFHAPKTLSKVGKLNSASTMRKIRIFNNEKKLLDAAFPPTFNPLLHDEVQARILIYVYGCVNTFVRLFQLLRTSLSLWVGQYLPTCIGSWIGLNHIYLYSKLIKLFFHK